MQILFVYQFLKPYLLLKSMGRVQKILFHSKVRTASIHRSGHAANHTLPHHAANHTLPRPLTRPDNMQVGRSHDHFKDKGRNKDKDHHTQTFYQAGIEERFIFQTDKTVINEGETIF